jgi:dCTP deaminase
MTILSDTDIKDAMKASTISIEPFSEKGLTPNGYDLRICEGEVDGQEKITEGTLVIPPKTWFAVSTLEYVRLGAEYSAHLWLRTTWARRGIVAQFGMIDAGYEGNMTFTGFNAKSVPIEIPIGERFCQMVIEPMASAAEKMYAERSGTYFKKKGLQLDEYGND